MPALPLSPGGQRMDSGMDSAARTGMDSGADSLCRKWRCRQGFSPLQIAILSLLKASPSVIAYWLIAQQVMSAWGLQTTEGAVRGAMERMFRRGFLGRNRTASGRMQGNRYTFLADPCPHIRPCSPGMESGMDSETESAAQSGRNAALSSLRKIDRENLSIFSEGTESQKTARSLESLTEDDIAFHWPHLAKAGFGTCQIRQIAERLAQVNISVEKVMQGLTYAEWELETGNMRDKEGKAIELPVNWVFAILAKQGYYPRPQGYVSPQEQAELDAAEEAKRITIARKARVEADCGAWIAGLSQEQRRTILAEQQSQFSIPEHIVFSRYYREKIRPVLEGGEAQNSTAKAAGHVD
jgi:hypothetical protein